MTADPAAPPTTIEKLDRFRGSDLNDLCDAADAAIRDGGGFGWLVPPPREVMERYWRGVLVVPERLLFVARLDGVVAGSVQLARPPRNNEAQAHAGFLSTAFVTPWARGRGLARGMIRAAEAEGRKSGLRVLNLDVRETQAAAIALFRSLGFQHWGTHPLYAMVEGRTVAGLFFHKDLHTGTAPPPDPSPANGPSP